MCYRWQWFFVRILFVVGDTFPAILIAQFSQPNGLQVSLAVLQRKFLVVTDIKWVNSPQVDEVLSCILITFLYNLKCETLNFFFACVPGHISIHGNIRFSKTMHTNDQRLTNGKKFAIFIFSMTTYSEGFPYTWRHDSHQAGSKEEWDEDRQHCSWTFDLKTEKGKCYCIYFTLIIACLAARATFVIAVLILLLLALLLLFFLLRLHCRCYRHCYCWCWWYYSSWCYILFWCIVISMFLYNAF